MRYLVLALTFLIVLSPLEAQRRGGRTGSAGPKGSPVPLANEPAADFTGTLKGIDKSKLRIELEGGNSMEFRTTKKTKVTMGGKDVKLAELAIGQVVEIEVHHVVGALEAVSIKVLESHDKQLKPSN